MGLLGSIMGTSGAASDAAAAAAEANRVQEEIYKKQREDLSGYRDLGQVGLDQVKNNLGDLTGTFSMDKFQKDPGYDFRMQEGQKALERSASARGGLLSGGTLKSLAQYGQNFASNEYGNAYNRFNQDRDQRYGKLMDLVGTGQNASAQTGAAGQNYANAYGQNVIGAANASGAARIAEGSALMGLVGQGIGAYAMGGAGGAVAGGAGGGALPGLGDYNSRTSGIISSDRRLKKNIERLETSKFKDVPTYSYEYKDESHGEGKQVGVMAQDLLELDPHHPAVGTRDGFYTVNYSMLEGA